VKKKFQFTNHNTILASSKGDFETINLDIPSMEMEQHKAIQALLYRMHIMHNLLYSLGQ
jgi:putative lipoic acid-binding regulatory protein